MRTCGAAASERAKEAVVLLRPREGLLGALELFEGGCAVERSERRGVGEGVIADAVAFFDGAAGNGSASRIGDFVAEHEERRLQIVSGGKAVEHGGRYEGLRPVVESQGNLMHSLRVPRLRLRGYRSSPHRRGL